MSSTNHHDDRIEVLSVPDESDLPPPPSVQPIHFTPAPHHPPHPGHAGSIHSNGHARMKRHQYYNLARQSSHDDHLPLTPEDIQLVGTPGDESLRIITPLSPGDDSLRMLTTPLSYSKQQEEEEEVQTKQQKRVARIVAVIAGALIVMSVLLVTITMRMSDHIDDMVRKMHGIGLTTPDPYPAAAPAATAVTPPLHPALNHSYTPPAS